MPKSREETSSPISTDWTVGRTTLPTSSAVGTRPALARHPGNTGAVGMGVLEREIDSNEDRKTPGLEQARPCVAQALVEINLQVEGVEHR